MPGWRTLISEHNELFLKRRSSALQHIGDDGLLSLTNALVIGCILPNDRIRVELFGQIVTPIRSLFERLIQDPSFVANKELHAQTVNALLSAFRGIAITKERLAYELVAQSMLGLFPTFLQLFELYHDNYLVTANILLLIHDFTKTQVLFYSFTHFVYISVYPCIICLL